MVNYFFLLLFYLYEILNIYRLIYFLILKSTNEYYKVHEFTCICVSPKYVMILAVRYPYLQNNEIDNCAECKK